MLWAEVLELVFHILGCAWCGHDGPLVFVWLMGVAEKANVLIFARFVNFALGGPRVSMPPCTVQAVGGATAVYNGVLGSPCLLVIFSVNGDMSPFYYS